MNQYKVRANSLELIGVTSYKEYLKSDIWKKTRNKIIKRFKGKCQACGSKNNLNVHHTRYGYKTLEGKTKGLYLLCAYCHKEVHDLSELKNISLRQATREVIRGKNI